MSENKTDFGFKQVEVKEKAKLVANVFSSVASRYDVMNDVMSFGAHRIWKRLLASHTNLQPGQHALDVAGGTGDISMLLSRQVGSNGSVTLTDINQEMLDQGRMKLIDKGYADNINFVRADAENLPFDKNSFDCVTIAFGLRNVTDKNAALSSMYKVLKPGGRLLILEFSKPTSSLLSKIYDGYSFNILPKMGKYIARDEDSYKYLAESIRMHPDQETLKSMMLDAGYERCAYYNMTGGIVALHKGIKL